VSAVHSRVRTVEETREGLKQGTGGESVNLRFELCMSVARAQNYGNLTLEIYYLDILMVFHVFSPVFKFLKKHKIFSSKLFLLF
jgi:hypothetical protein